MVLITLYIIQQAGDMDWEATKEKNGVVDEAILYNNYADNYIKYADAFILADVRWLEAIHTNLYNTQ